MQTSTLPPDIFLSVPLQKTGGRWGIIMVFFIDMFRLVLLIALPPHRVCDVTADKRPALTFTAITGWICQIHHLNLLFFLFWKRVSHHLPVIFDHRNVCDSFELVTEHSVRPNIWEHAASKSDRNNVSRCENVHHRRSDDQLPIWIVPHKTASIKLPSHKGSTTYWRLLCEANEANRKLGQILSSMADESRADFDKADHWDWMLIRYH